MVFHNVELGVVSRSYWHILFKYVEFYCWMNPTPLALSGLRRPSISGVCKDTCILNHPDSPETLYFTCSESSAQFVSSTGLFTCNFYSHWYTSI